MLTTRLSETHGVSSWWFNVVLQSTTEARWSKQVPLLVGRTIWDSGVSHWCYIPCDDGQGTFKSQAVHFNNFQLYKKKQEGSMEGSGAREAAEVHKGAMAMWLKRSKCLQKLSVPFCGTLLHNRKKRKMLTHFERSLMWLTLHTYFVSMIAFETQLIRQNISQSFWC